MRQQSFKQKHSMLLCQLECVFPQMSTKPVLFIGGLCILESLNKTMFQQRCIEIIVFKYLNLGCISE